MLLRYFHPFAEDFFSPIKIGLSTVSNVRFLVNPRDVFLRGESGDLAKNIILYRVQYLHALLHCSLMRRIYSVWRVTLSRYDVIKLLTKESIHPISHVVIQPPPPHALETLLI